MCVCKKYKNSIQILFLNVENGTLCSHNINFKLLCVEYVKEIIYELCLISAAQISKI